jgi:hypothetical protein
MGIVEKIFDVEYQVINKVREKIEVGNVTVILMSVEHVLIMSPRWGQINLEKRKEVKN